MYQAIIFDFDYTLSDRSFALHEGLKRIVELFLKLSDEIEKEALIQKLMVLDGEGTNGRAPLIKYLCRNYQLDEADIKPYFDTLSYDMAKYTLLDSAALTVLTTLGKEGYKLAILTNGDINTQYLKIDTVSLRPYFDVVMASLESGVMKPKALPFLEVAKKLGVEPQNCLYVGDVFFSDALGAYRAKMDYILINNSRKHYYPPFVKQIAHLSDLLSYLKEKGD